MFFAPAASSISAADSAMSGIIVFSFSPQAMWIFSTGMPKMSTWPVRVDLDEVLVARQALAEADEADAT